MIAGRLALVLEYRDKPEEILLTYLPKFNPASHTLISKGKDMSNIETLIYPLSCLSFPKGWMHLKVVHPVSTLKPH